MHRRLNIIILCLTLSITSCFAIACQKKDNLSSNDKQKIEKLKMPLTKDNFVDMDVYFKSSKDDKDDGISKESRSIDKNELLGEAIMQQLIKGPAVTGDLKPVLPKETRLLTFSIKDNVAYVNLSSEAKASMSDASEYACLKSIVMSLTQIPTISRIQIQIQNKNVDTLGGNYDISKPFGKDSIEKKKK